MNGFFNLDKMKTDWRGMFVRFPIEWLICLIFTVVAVMYGHHGENELFAKLSFFPICFLVCLGLNFLLPGQMRWLYYLSVLVAVPVLIFPMEDHVDSFGYVFGLLLSLLLLFLCRRSTKENPPFCAYSATLAGDIVTAGIFMAVLAAVIYAVLGSLVYLFDFDEALLDYGYQWPLFLLGPMFFCLRCDSHGPQGFGNTVPPFLAFISKYIVTPAIILYTLILYVYVLRALVTWSLPLGGVAVMVMIYFAVAVAGKMLDEWTGVQIHHGFYRRLSWVMWPILLLFWWGLMYRIHRYALTEARVYLIAAGIVMTSVTVMMGIRKLNRYRLFALMAACVLILLTYIPGISAKSIGVASQQARMKSIAASLELLDSSGKLLKPVRITDYDMDTLHELAEAYAYLRREMGQENLEELAGVWYSDIVRYDHTEAEFFRPCDNPLPLDKYRCFLGYLKRFRYDYSDNRLKIFFDDTTVLDSPVDTAELNRAYQSSTEPSEKVFALSNDSVMVVINAFKRLDEEKWSFSEAAVFSTGPVLK